MNHIATLCLRAVQDSGFSMRNFSDHLRIAIGWMARKQSLPRMRTQSGFIEPWVAVTLSLIVMWFTAAVRHRRWLSGTDEHSKTWQQKWGKMSYDIKTILGAWIIENGCIFATALSLNRLTMSADRKSFSKLYASTWARSLIAAESNWIALRILANHVYKSKPFFASDERMPHPSLADFVISWVRLFVPMRVFTGMGEANAVRKMSDETFQLRIGGKPAGLASFLFQFAIARSLHDLAFFVGHRIIHLNKMYSMIHKRHHEHKEPNILTNNHFWILDLFIEAVLSLSAAYLGIGMLKQAGFNISQLQVQYIICACLWYEAGSHSGKALPCVTVFPPLSFIPWIDHIFGGGVAHHHAHHRYLQCNYSIAAWPDRAFGTWRPLLDDRTNVATADKTHNFLSPSTSLHCKKVACNDTIDEGSGTPETSI